MAKVLDGKYDGSFAPAAGSASMKFEHDSTYFRNPPMEEYYKMPLPT